MCGNGPQIKLNRQIEHCKVQGSDTSFPNERIQKELKNEQRKRRHVIIQKSLRWLLCVIYKRGTNEYKKTREYETFIESQEWAMRRYEWNAESSTLQNHFNLPWFAPSASLILPLKFDSLILKTHLIWLWGVSKMHFWCPLCLWLFKKSCFEYIYCMDSFCPIFGVWYQRIKVAN